VKEVWNRKERRKNGRDYKKKLRSRQEIPPEIKRL
jgi:hypothetical protein